MCVCVIILIDELVSMYVCQFVCVSVCMCVSMYMCQYVCVSGFFPALRDRGGILAKNLREQD